MVMNVLSVDCSLMDMIASREDGCPLVHQRLTFGGRYYRPDDIEELHRTMADIGVQKGSTLFCSPWFNTDSVPSGQMMKIKVFAHIMPTALQIGDIECDTKTSGRMLAMKIWQRWPGLVRSPHNLELWTNVQPNGDGFIVGDEIAQARRIPSTCDRVHLHAGKSKEEKRRRATQLSRVDATKQVVKFPHECCPDGFDLMVIGQVSPGVLREGDFDRKDIPCECECECECESASYLPLPPAPNGHCYKRYDMMVTIRAE